MVNTRFGLASTMEELAKYAIPPAHQVFVSPTNSQRGTMTNDPEDSLSPKSAYGKMLGRFNFKPKKKDKGNSITKSNDVLPGTQSNTNSIIPEESFVTEEKPTPEPKVKVNFFEKILENSQLNFSFFSRCDSYNKFYNI